MTDVVHLATPEGHRLTFHRDLGDAADLLVPGDAVSIAADGERYEVNVPGDLLRRLVSSVVEGALVEPEPPGTLDLDLLRRLASGVGGARTGALKRAGFLTWQVTPDGVEALNAHAAGWDHESPTVRFARDELQRAGLFDEDTDYGPTLAENIIEIVRLFCSMGHSGGSAAMSIAILEKLLRHRPLTKLTSDPGEWADVSGICDYPFWQNRRNPAAFSFDGGTSWYDQEDGDPLDALQLAPRALWVLHPDRKWTRIGRLEGIDGIGVTFADRPGEVVVLRAAEVVAAAARPRSS